MAQSKGTRSLKSCLLWLLGALALMVVILVIAGLVFETTSTASAQELYPPSGQMIEVGDYLLHLNVMGENQGLPAVILEHGGGSMSAQWGWVQTEIARYTQVVAYDRPGLGWSESSPDPSNAEQVVNHLRLALQEAGIPGPYVLVGHSMGGLLVRVYAALYPEEVVGLVLVDPRDVEWGNIYQPEELESGKNMIRLLTYLSRIGLVRISGAAAQDLQGLPPDYYEEALGIYSSYQHWDGILADAEVGDSAAEFLRRGENLEEVPLIVLSASEPDGAFDARQREIFLEQHAQIASLSAQGRHRIVNGAGHVTIVTHQEHASAISQAIFDLLE